MHHVGIAVEDMEDAIRFYRDHFGLVAEPVAPPPGSALRFAIVRLPGAEIELLASTTDATPIAKFLAKRGPGIHHLAFAVDDIRAAMAATSRLGIPSLDAEPAPGIKDTLACFFHPKATQGVLVEFVQPAGRD